MILLCEIRKVRSRAGTSVEIAADGTTLFQARPQRQLPGVEYCGVFDLVHAGVLHWSPNVVTALPQTQSLVLGSLEERGTENLIDSMTYALATHEADLTVGSALDPELLAAITTAAARATSAPTSLPLWERCLARTLEVYRMISQGGVRTLHVDLEGSQVYPSH